MNKVLQPFLDRFVVVYLDDIVVYGTTLEDHAQHLQQCHVLIFLSISGKVAALAVWSLMKWR